MADNKDFASEQLNQFKNLNIQDSANEQNMTRLFGGPIYDFKNSLTVGPRGPILLQDVQFLEQMAHFDRERIPERVVHAKGSGAFGYFEVTNLEIKKYCKAKLFDTLKKRTPVVARFSTVGGELGSADTVRDPRGFALRFYTEEGNWDMVGNNTPIFFIRDPILFPTFIHTQKRNPQTNIKDPNAVWDFFGCVPSTMHQFVYMFGDRGIPDGFRHMNGYGSHTFKLVNENNEAFYTKFHFITQQGIKNLDVKEATRLAGEDPDYSTRDLYNAIAGGNYPKWKFCIQIMTYDQAKKYKFNPFDVTKVWSKKEFPLIEVGDLVLNENAKNHFAQIEQLAFCPSNMVPGIEPSPDRMLLGRLFSYQDTQRHRLGANYHKIPVNKPKCPFMNPTVRDGPYCFDENGGNLPNYYPNSLCNWKLYDKRFKGHVENVTGDVDRHDSTDDDNYEQVTNLWLDVLNEDERERLVENIADSLKLVTVKEIQQRALENFDKVHKDLGSRIRKKIGIYKAKL